MLQKPEGDRDKAPMVKLYSATAIPWQRRIWWPPTFPKGKKDEEKFAPSWNAPMIYSKNDSRMCPIEDNHGDWRFFSIFFMQHWG